MEPRAGTWSTAFGKICPKATTTATSAPNSARRLGHSGSRSRTGCTTGSPAARALALTGGGVRRRPRCAGRSGWVTTATTSCWWRSASRVGSANSGVPSKRTLKREGVVGGVLAETFLLDPPLDAVAGHGVEAVNEEDPVEVVQLVLEEACAQPARLDRDGRTVGVVGLDPHPRRARDRREDARDREAPFLGGRLSSVDGDDRIDQRLGAVPLLVADDDQPERDTDLWRGEADADLVVHRVDHVQDDRAELGRHLADGLGAPPEHRVAVFPDPQNGHSTGSTSTSMIPRPSRRGLRNSSSAAPTSDGSSAGPFTTIRRMRFRRSAPGG